MGVYSEAAARLIMPVDDNPMGLLEFSVRSQSADTAMFESMLEMDFAEYFSESGQIVLTEKEEAEKSSNGIKKIFEKLAELFQKAWNALSQFVSRLVAKLADITGFNKKLVAEFDKRGASLDKAKEMDREKEVYRIRGIDNGNIKDEKLKSVREKVNRAYNLVKPEGSDALSKEKADSTKKELNDAIDSATSSEHFNSMFEKTNIGSLGSIGDYKEFLNKGYKALFEGIIGDAKKDMDLYKKARQEALKAVAKSKDEERESAASKFSLASTLVSVNSKYINYASRLALQAVAYSRKTITAIMVASGRKEAKKSKAKEETVNASFVYDDYLELALEFAADDFVEDITFA